MNLCKGHPIRFVELGLDQLRASYLTGHAFDFKLNGSDVCFFDFCIRLFAPVVTGNKNHRNQEYGQDFIEYFHGVSKDLKSDIIETQN